MAQHDGTEKRSQSPSLSPAPHMVPGGTAWRLAEVLDNRSDVARLRMSLISLEPACAHFGLEWPRVSAKVQHFVEGELKAAAGSENVYLPVDELSYIVLSFERASTALQLDELSARVSAKIMGRGIQKDLIRVTHLLVSRDETSAPQAAESKAPDGGTQRRISHIERILEEASQKADEFSVEKVEFVISPICSLEDMSYSSSFCRPIYVDNHGRMRCGYNVLPPGSEVALYAEMDALTAERAGKELAQMTTGDAQRTMFVPVHRATISSRKYRELYLKVCHSLLLPNRANVIFDIYAIEDGTPPNRVAEHMQWLRPYGQAIAMTVDIDYGTLGSFAGLNAYSVGTDLTSADPANVNQRMSRFAGRVRDLKAKCHIHGVNSKSVAGQCLSLGIDSIDSDPLADGSEAVNEV